MSETESLPMDSEDDASTATTHGSLSPMTADSETDEEEADPWMSVVEEAMQEHNKAFQKMKMNLIHSGLDEQTAGEKAYSNIPPELQNDSPMDTTTQERSSAYENYANKVCAHER